MAALQELEGLRAIAKICDEVGLSLANALHMLFHEVELFSIINQVGVDKVIDFLKRWVEEAKERPELRPFAAQAELRLDFLKRYRELSPKVKGPPLELTPSVSPEEVYEYMVRKGLVSKEEIEAYVRVSTLFGECLQELTKQRARV